MLMPSLPGLAQGYFETKILASDGVREDHFGWTIGMDGDRLVVGAPSRDDDGENSGAAYILERVSLGNWSEVARLNAPNAQAADDFGRSLAIHGDTLVVGAKFALTFGAAYVYQRLPATGDWQYVKTLSPSDAFGPIFFGYSVDIAGDTIVVGAPESLAGDVYVYQRDHGGPGNWGEVTKLDRIDPEAGDNFGISVALDADTAVVGLSYDNDQGVDSGSAYVFGRDVDGPNGWGQVTKLLATDGSTGWHFGESTATSGDIVVVGAFAADDAGAAYVFERNKGGRRELGRGDEAGWY